MFPSYRNSHCLQDLNPDKGPYPRRLPIAGRSYQNPGPGILSAGNLVERESVIIAHPRFAARNDTSEHSKPVVIPEKKEKDSIIRRLLTTDGPVGSATNPIVIGEDILMAPPQPTRSIMLLSDEEKQRNNHLILKTLESVVPLKKRKLPFSAELSALPLPIPPQQIDNIMPVLEPEQEQEQMEQDAVSANDEDAEETNVPIPNIVESALIRALAAPPLTMQTKNGVTLHAFAEGREQLVNFNESVLEPEIIRLESEGIETEIVEEEPQSQPKVLAKYLNQCGHSVRRLIVVPTLDEDGNWLYADYICKQCGWAKKCNTQLHHYKELLQKKEGENFLGLSTTSGFQRSSPYDEEPEQKTSLGENGAIPRNLECNNQQVVTGNSLLHQTGFRREVTYVDTVPSNSSLRYGMPFMRDGSILKTYICELCLRVEETLWDMTEHRDTDHLGSPVNFLELCSNEKDAMRFRCAAISESDTCKELRIPTLTTDSLPPPPIYL